MRYTKFSLTLELYWDVRGHPPVSLFPRKNYSTHFTGDLVDLAVGLGGYRKWSPQPDLEHRTDQPTPIRYTL